MLTFDEIPGLTGARNLNGYYNEDDWQAGESKDGYASLWTATEVTIRETGRITKENLEDLAEEIIETALSFGLKTIEVAFLSHDLERGYVFWDDPYTQEELETDSPCATCEKAKDCTEKANRYRLLHVKADLSVTNSLTPVYLPANVFTLENRKHYIILQEDKDNPNLFHIIQDNRKELDPQTALAEGILLNGIDGNLEKGELQLCKGLTCRFRAVDDTNCIPVLVREGREKELPPLYIEYDEEDDELEQTMKKMGTFLSMCADIKMLADAASPLLSENEYFCTENGILSIRDL